ncbi:DUF2382 domain-containing protein [Kytococcus sedentarius]|uniref:DUF2382 domain-containing protein n=1 Tax=Kytococcus sedentarius TaxID=1276 RepID=UPI0019510548|nr:DUF2382 domain-containing protein [Kytococcus sedentarius]QRO87110.1 DUF2382 domain-containing protein [Kytococcus sedentarius]
MDNRAGDRTSLVRHEEKLTAAVQRVARGATRVRKRVITETVTVEVEVQREVLEVEEAPAAASGIAAGGTGTAADTAGGQAVGAEQLAQRQVDAQPREEEVQVVTLHRQRPVVTLETVPYEEVRVVKRTVTVPHEVTETVRREHVDVHEVDAEGVSTGDFR